jgi:hypothetical protein
MTGACYCKPFNLRVLSLAFTVNFSDASSQFIADSSSSAQMDLVSRLQVEVRPTITQTKGHKE